MSRADELRRFQKPLEEQRIQSAKRHVFLSYVRDNTTIVDSLKSDLNEAGIEVWLDREQIRPGVRWRNAIRQAIENGNFFLACFSREYVEKEKTFMNEELAIAIDELRQYSTTRAWFIPVKLSECEIPSLELGGGQCLRGIQWIDLSEDWKGGIARLVETLSSSKVPHPQSGNSILMQQDQPFERRIEELVKRWKKDGRTANWLLTGKSYFAAQCWVFDHKIYDTKSATYDADISDFIAASRSISGGSASWEDLLRTRSFCAYCRQPFRMENMQICTGCMDYACHRCGDLYHKSCAGEMVG